MGRHDYLHRLPEDPARSLAAEPEHSVPQAQCARKSSPIPVGGASGHRYQSLADVDELDDRIIDMVLRRSQIIGMIQARRREAGLPARELAWENVVARRYATRLGRPGADVARSVLSLSQIAFHRDNSPKDQQ